MEIILATALGIWTIFMIVLVIKTTDSLGKNRCSEYLKDYYDRKFLSTGRRVIMADHDK